MLWGSNAVVAGLSLIGRRRDVAHVHHLLGESRLVTLTGPPGCGKTRLAAVALEGIGIRHPDGVVVVELEALTDDSAVPGEVLASLGVTGTRRRSTTVEALAARLGSRRLLVLLDGCDGVRSAAAELSASLLARCCRLTLLLTSQEPVGARGELAWRVRPLRADATSLLLDRMATWRPGLRLAAEEIEVLGRVCRRLSWLPLALEVIAPAVADLRPLEAERRLGRGAPATGGMEPLPPHEALAAAFDVGHGLLAVGPLRILRRLAVLHGWWPRRSVLAVCAGRGLSAPAIEDIAAELADRHLLRRRVGPGSTPAYRLPAALRGLVGRLLFDSGEEPDTLRRHRRHYLVLPDRRLGTDWLEAERADIRAVLADQRVPACGRLRLAVWSGPLWRRGRWEEGRRWLDPGQAGSAGGALRAAVLSELGRLAAAEGSPAEAQAYLTHSLACGTWRRPGRRLAAILTDLAAVERRLGDIDLARHHLNRALVAAAQPGPERARAHLGLANLAVDCRDLPEAMTRVHEALRDGGPGLESELFAALRGLARELAGEDPERALVLAAAAEAAATARRTVRASPQGWVELAMAAVGPAAARASWEAGAGLDLATALTQASVAPAVPAAVAGPWAGLSRRQAAVLDLAAAGLTDKQIAARLGVSFGTVRTHLERMYRRQGIRGRTALVAGWSAWRAAGGSGSALLPTPADLLNSADLSATPPARTLGGRAAGRW